MSTHFGDLLAKVAPTSPTSRTPGKGKPRATIHEQYDDPTDLYGEDDYEEPADVDDDEDDYEDVSDEDAQELEDEEDMLVQQASDAGLPEDVQQCLSDILESDGTPDCFNGMGLTEDMAQQVYAFLAGSDVELAVEVMEEMEDWADMEGIDLHNMDDMVDDTGMDTAVTDDMSMGESRSSVSTDKEPKRTPKQARVQINENIFKTLVDRAELKEQAAPAVTEMDKEQPPTSK